MDDFYAFYLSEQERASRDSLKLVRGSERADGRRGKREKGWIAKGKLKAYKRARRSGRRK